MLGLIQKKDLAERESRASDSVLIVKHGKPPQLCRKSPISLSNQDTLIQTIMDIVISDDEASSSSSVLIQLKSDYEQPVVIYSSSEM